MMELPERAIDPPDDRPACATCGESLSLDRDGGWPVPIRVQPGVYVCAVPCAARWTAVNGTDLTERLEALLELEDQPTLRIVARPFGTFITAFLGSLAGREDRGGLYYFEDLDSDKIEILAENIDLLEVLG